ncbi:GntR family transcriptional regulator [Streptomyces sp. NPDC003300]|uniref:GntR family transcriptional regulator n=1 Tax=unclassified Streptomyces TaxID=2593676 RepID=UPI0033BC7766
MTSRHQHVADDLRRLITSGALAVGERLAPETRLAARYHVSTPTLRDALELLRTEGLIEKFQGRGNFVRRPPQRLTYPGVAVDGDDGLQVIVSSADITATGDLAARLRTPPDAPITQYVCLSHRDDSPQGLAHLYIPHAVTRATSDVRNPPVSASPWADDIVRSLTTATGEPVANSTDLVTARFPTGAEAQSLRIATRTPVLSIERTITADDGQVLAYVLLVLPGDRAEVAFVTPIDKKTDKKTDKKAETR